MEVAKTHQDQLDRIKKNVKMSYEAFKPNYDRWNEFRRFIFETSLTQDDISLLVSQSKPQIEFNISEAYISRLMGEFSKQEPSISVSSEDEDTADPTTIHVVEQHIRHIMRDNKTQNVRWDLMKDIYSGGFAVGKVRTDYANPMSMKQVILYDRGDATMCGFDQVARQTHKGDGRFCFECVPYALDDFKNQFPDIKVDDLDYSRSFGGFTWAYLNGNEKIVLVCDYYEKKKKRVKIMELANNRTVTEKEYKEMQMEADRVGEITQLPAVRGEPRWTDLETVVRYRCIANTVIEYEETDFTYFPLVFMDGNSITLRNPKTSGAVQQITRPYVYHAKGAQRLKNFAGITLANELENIVQHKFMVAKEALPKEMDWLAAYKDVQKPSNLIYNAFYEQDPDQQIPNPIQAVPRVNCPPEVVQTFASTDSLIQNILGSYDASLGINDNQLSGVAIVEAATQSNAAAMPYIVGFLQGLQRIAEIFIDLIPKYYKTPRTIPVMGIDGKADYVKINQDQGVDMFYDSNVLNVNVEAGVSFQVQKSKALQQLIALQQANPLFAQFMADKGLMVMLDNLEIRGIDQLKMLVEDWLQQRQQQMAQQQQNDPQNMKNQLEQAKLQQTGQLETAKIQQKAQEMKMNDANQQKQFQIDIAHLKQDQMKLMQEASASKDENMTQRIKAEAERFSKQVDMAMKDKDMKHRHLTEAIDLHHNITQAKHSNMMDKATLAHQMKQASKPNQGATQ